MYYVYAYYIVDVDFRYLTKYVIHGGCVRTLKQRNKYSLEFVKNSAAICSFDKNLLTNVKKSAIGALCHLGQSFCYI